MGQHLLRRQGRVAVHSQLMLRGGADRVMQDLSLQSAGLAGYRYRFVYELTAPACGPPVVEPHLVVRVPAAMFYPAVEVESAPRHLECRVPGIRVLREL